MHAHQLNYSENAPKRKPVIVKNPHDGDEVEPDDRKPFMKMFPNDVQSDEALRQCGLSAHGLWWKMLMEMWRSPERGVLRKANGEPVRTAKEVARFLGLPLRGVRQAFEELEREAVFSRSADGAVTSRRILRDHFRSTLYAANAAKGHEAHTKLAPANCGIWNMESDQIPNPSGSGSGEEQTAGQPPTASAPPPPTPPTPPREDPPLVPTVEPEPDDPTPSRHLGLVPPSTVPVSLPTAVSSFNRGIGDSGIVREAAPSGRTFARDRFLAAALMTFATALDWEWCGRALAASEHHRGENSTGWRADLLWLTRNRNGELEKFMALGVEMREGRYQPPKKKRPMSIAEHQIAESIELVRAAEAREAAQQEDIDFERAVPVGPLQLDNLFKLPWQK